MRVVMGISETVVVLDYGEEDRWRGSPSVPAIPAIEAYLGPA